MDGILTPFNVGTGVDGGLSGRILPAGWTPPDGTYAYCLGYDKPGRIESMKAGDSVTIAQTSAVPSGITLLKVRAFLRSPTLAPPGSVDWILSLLVGTTELARRKLAVGRKRDLFDLGACMRTYAGASNTIKVMLALVGTGGPFDVEMPGVYVDKVDFI